jgi:hypothetical protein
MEVPLTEAPGVTRKFVQASAGIVPSISTHNMIILPFFILLFFLRLQDFTFLQNYQLI